VLLESAWFDPISIRRTSKALGLRTEASLRFERGADPEMAELASRRCAALIRELAGGEILAGVVDVYPGRRASRRLELSRAGACCA
jgi:phenylalanyl-tRNA synthetase beta chain